MNQLTLTGTTVTGGTATLYDPVKLFYSVSIYPMRSSLRVKLRLQEVKNQYLIIRARRDGQQFFAGRVDRQTEQLEPDGWYLILECSGMEAALLENQVAPRVWNNLTKDQLSQNYLVPFGIGEDLDPATVSTLEITRGMTAWNVVDVFCRQAYGYMPSVNRNYQLTVDLFDNTTFVIGNQQPEDHRYTKIRYRDDRSGLITRVYQENPNQPGDYSAYVDNQDAQKFQISRVRFYHPPKAWENNPLLGASEIIRDSNRTSREVLAVLPEWLDGYPGNAIQFRDTFLNETNFYIGKLEVSIGPEGCRTNLYAWDYGKI